MKLVELLARELKVWPEEATKIAQDTDRCAHPYSSVDSFFGKEWGGIVKGSSYSVNMPELATDHATAIITRADWEAEVARLAKPEQSPRERIKELHALAMAVGMCVSVENPISWRDRIHEIDITVEALEEERVGLVQQLEDEGFQLIVL